MGRLAQKLERIQTLVGESQVKEELEELKSKVDLIQDVSSEEAFTNAQLRLQVLDTDMQLLLHVQLPPSPSSPFDDKTPEERIEELHAQIANVLSLASDVMSIQETLREGDPAFQTIYSFSSTLHEAERTNSFLTEQLTTTQDAIAVLQDSIEVNTKRMQAAMTLLASPPGCAV